MLKLTPIPQRYTHSIDIFSLPAEHQTAARNFARENEGNCYGDFYLLLNFDLLAHDATPDAELQKFIDSDDENLMSEGEAANYSDERYPVRGWSGWSGCTVLADYIGWLRALRYIHANLPVEAQESKTLALFCWH